MSFPEVDIDWGFPPLARKIIRELLSVVSEEHIGDLNSLADLVEAGRKNPMVVVFLRAIANRMSDALRKVHEYGV